MQMNAWFAIPKQLQVEALAFEHGGVTVFISTNESAARCPQCGYSSRRVHSRYRRTLADLPWGGVPVRFYIQVRKLYCDNSNCRRKIFAECLEVAHRYARRTNQQRGALEDIGLALGGEAGVRLAVGLGLRTSPDTVLRFTKQATGMRDEPVRVLGIDDWCWRRRLRYGTILVDLERHRVVDLLPDREVESVVDWLRQHPEVEIIVRDRGDTYTDAALVRGHLRPCSTQRVPAIAGTSSRI